MKDFVPISVFGAGPFVLGIQKSIPAQNLQEFIAFAKRRAAKSTMAPAARARSRISPVRCSRNVPASRHTHSLQGRWPGGGGLHLGANRNVFR